MENASKALIIAGAILLSIIIISLGIMVVNNARNQIGGQNLNKEQIQTFNAQWENYVGNTKTASEVRAMITSMIANNAAESQSGENRWVSLTNGKTAVSKVATKQPTITVPSLSSAVTYTVVAGYGTNGLIVGLAYQANK